MPSNPRTVIRNYYGFQFFFSLLIWLPIFYQYQKQIGLSDPQIFSIQSIYYLVFCFLEIPTGLLADLFGTLNCMRLGALVLTLANVLPILNPTFGGFLAHFILIALSRSLISGASSAYLYDFLTANGAGTDYKQIEGKARAYGLIGKVICWSLVGVLMKWHRTLPYSLTTVAAAISVGYAWALPSGLKNTLAAAKIRPQLAASLGGALRAMKASPLLVFLMLQGVAIFVLGRICQVNLFQPILDQKGFNLAYYGLVMSLMTVFEAVGSAFPLWFRRFSSDLNAVFILTVVMAASLLLIPQVGQTATVACLSLFSLAAGFSFPIQRQLLNDAIPDSRYRATILSAESIVDRAVCAWVASLLGSSLSHGRLNGFLVSSALVTCLGVGVLFLMLKMRRFRQFQWRAAS